MKRILLLADLHQQNYVLKNLDNFLFKNKFSGIILAGDLTNRNYSSLDYAKKFEAVIKKNKLTLFYIPGNNDHEDVIDYFEHNNYSVHLKGKHFGGFKIIGIGGVDDVYMPLGFSSSNSILVTHMPPILSNKNFKDAPPIHIFGHTHFWEYSRKQGSTSLIQLKAAIYNRAAILELPILKVQFINFKI